MTVLAFSAPAAAQERGGELVIAKAARANAVIVIAADTGPWEKQAAVDLQTYIGKMTGAVPRLAIGGTLADDQSAIVIGKAALAADPTLAARLAGVAKAHPVVQADAVALHRVGNRVYLAGSNDESHYFAASWLLQSWGCRWYLPTDFGEVVPHVRRLSVGALDVAYAPPFDIRRYWLAWNGDETGAALFRHRNFMSDADVPGAGQELDRYTADIAPKGGTAFNVPFADPATADHIGDKIAPAYRAGKNVFLAIADGIYANDDPRDRPLVTQYDPYMLRPSLTDAMMTLYNRVAGRLRALYPTSNARIGGLAYVNVTLPPVLVTKADPHLVMWIAPIDIDPNHGIDDPRSPERQAYGRMVERWAHVMDGRLAIYDYDQGMLIWRDLPDPSQDVFARDVKLYARLGILGIATESRGAAATTFLNLFFRGQLMWNPRADTAAMLRDFYPGFYGPAAPAMVAYWETIFAAWRATAVTEHEAFAAPVLYTPTLVAKLAPHIAAAKAALAAARLPPDDARRYDERMRFTEASSDLIRDFVAMTAASATEADYPAAARAGAAMIATRLDLARINPTFTTHVVGPGAERVADGAAWLSGENAWFGELARLTDGTKGMPVERLPLIWTLRLGAPLPEDWRYTGERGGAGPCNATDAAAGGGAAGVPVRTDLYLQAQGVLRPDRVNALGDYCYRTTIDLAVGQAQGKLHLLFPGIFGEAWLAVDGVPVAHRSWTEPWWTGDYRFAWDIDVGGRIGPGRHIITVGGFNPLHFAGLFRRPFLYRPVDVAR